MEIKNGENQSRIMCWIRLPIIWFCARMSLDFSLRAFKSWTDLSYPLLLLSAIVFLLLSYFYQCKHVSHWAFFSRMVRTKLFVYFIVHFLVVSSSDKVIVLSWLFYRPRRMISSRNCMSWKFHLLFRPVSVFLYILVLSALSN